MRKPFVLTCGNRSPLTELQRRRRSRLITASRAYKGYLQRLIRSRRRRPERALPKAKSLFLRHASLQNPKIALFTEAIEALDAGLGKPVEELMIELDLWSRRHRSVVAAASSPGRS